MVSAVSALTTVSLMGYDISIPPVFLDLLFLSFLVSTVASIWRLFKFIKGE